MKRTDLLMVSIAIVWAFPALYAQGLNGTAQFEVASVKPGAAAALQVSAGGRATAIRSGCTGGPGTQDPGRYTCQYASLSTIISSAYELKKYQYSFPSWMDSVYFEIAAKVPAGTTKEQFRLMKQNLLAERFKLAAHFEKKEMQVYELVVGKDGPKLKMAAPEPAPGDSPDLLALDASKLPRGGDGLRVIPMLPGKVVVSIMTGGPNGPLMRMQAGAQTMEQFASTLAGQIGQPVIDGTGIQGKYDITVTCAPPDEMGLTPPPPPPVGAGSSGPAALAPADGPSIFVAIQKQLGLKLEQKKGAVDFLVIDHVEKTPVEN